MTTKFYGLDTQGIFQAQSVATLPTWSASDERRWVYAEDTKKCYYGTDVRWLEFGEATLTTNIPGFLTRSKFEYKDIDEIYIGPGTYHHQGTTEQTVYWDSRLTKQLVGAASTTWYFLYLDNSAIVSAGTNLLTASELLWSSSSPVWSDSKHGWYNGNDRCIFAVITTITSQMREFYHSSDFVSWAARISDLATTDIDTTWTDVSLTIPSFATQAEVTIFGSYVDGDATTSWRTDGQVANTGHAVSVYGSLSPEASNTLDVITSIAQIIEVRNSADNGNTVGVSTSGWYFPRGM